MQAITVSEYGAPPTLTDLPDPKAGPGEILVKIRAAGINPLDRSIAEGRMQAMMPATFPLILGPTWQVSSKPSERGPAATRQATRYSASC